MNGTKFTPGPWVVAVGLTERTTVCTMSPAPDWRLFRIDSTVREILPGEAKVNAHLISASPELLAALELARSYMLKDYPAESGPYVLPDYMERDLRSIDAAIAKAKGGAA